MQSAFLDMVLGEWKPHGRINLECKREEVRSYTWIC